MPKQGKYQKQNNTYPYLNVDMWIALESLKYYGKNVEGVYVFPTVDDFKSSGGSRDFAYNAIVYAIPRSPKNSDENWKKTIKKINKARKAKGFDLLPTDITREEYNKKCMESVTWNSEKGYYEPSENKKGNFAWEQQQSAKIWSVRKSGRTDRSGNPLTLYSTVITSDHIDVTAQDYPLNGAMHKFLMTKEGAQWMADNHIFGDVHGGHVHLSYQSSRTGGSLNRLGKSRHGVEWTAAPTDNTKYDKVKQKAADAGDENFIQNATESFDNNSGSVNWNGENVAVINSNDEVETVEEYTTRIDNVKQGFIDEGYSEEDANVLVEIYKEQPDEETRNEIVNDKAVRDRELDLRRNQITTEDDETTEDDNVTTETDDETTVEVETTPDAETTTEADVEVETAPDTETVVDTETTEVVTDTENTEDVEVSEEIKEVKKPNRFDYPLDPNKPSEGNVNPETKGKSYNEALKEYNDYIAAKEAAANQDNIETQEEGTTEEETTVETDTTTDETTEGVTEPEEEVDVYQKLIDEGYSDEDARMIMAIIDNVDSEERKNKIINDKEFRDKELQARKDLSSSYVWNDEAGEWEEVGQDGLVDSERTDADDPTTDADNQTTDTDNVTQETTTEETTTQETTTDDNQTEDVVDTEAKREEITKKIEEHKKQEPERPQKGVNFPMFGKKDGKTYEEAIAEYDKEYAEWADKGTQLERELAKVGSIPFQDGEYTGETNEDGFPEGKGKMVYDDGDVYEGTFENGEFKTGTYTDAQTGETRSGTWVGGNQFNGTITDKDGNTKDGVFYIDEDNNYISDAEMKEPVASFDNIEDAYTALENGELDITEGNRITVGDKTYVLDFDDQFEIDTSLNTAIDRTETDGVNPDEYRFNSDDVPIVTMDDIESGEAGKVGPQYFGRVGSDGNTVIVEDRDGRFYEMTWNATEGKYQMTPSSQEAYDLRRENEILSFNKETKDSVGNYTEDLKRKHEENYRGLTGDNLRKKIKKDLRTELGRKEYNKLVRSGELNDLVEEKYNLITEGVQEIRIDDNTTWIGYTKTVNGKTVPAGEGTMIMSNGDVFTGTVDDQGNILDGTMRKMDGTEEKGTFVDGNLSKGISTSINGEYRKGEFDADGNLVKGERKLNTQPDREQGTFENGELVDAYEVVYLDDGSVISTDEQDRIDNENYRREQAIEKGRIRDERIQQKIENGTLPEGVNTWMSEKEYDSWADATEIFDATVSTPGEIVKIEGQYYKIDPDGNSVTLWDIENDTPLANPESYGIETTLGNNVTIEQASDYLVEENQRLLEESTALNEEIQATIDKGAENLKKLGYSDEYIDLYKNQLNANNPHEEGSDEYNKWEENKRKGMIWDAERNTWLSGPSFTRKEKEDRPGISADQSESQQLDDYVIRQGNPYTLGKSKKEDRQYKKWNEQATKRGRDGEYKYKWNTQTNEFDRFGEDPTDLRDLMNPGTYTNQNGDRIIIDEFGNGFIERRTGIGSDGMPVYSEQEPFDAFDDIYQTSDFQQVTDPNAWFNQPENVTNLISGIIGIGGLAAAMKKVKPKDMPTLSSAFEERLRQSKELSKQGFSPAEEATIRNDINAAYTAGIDNLVRGTAGDRAKFLAGTGILDAQRATSLLQFAAMDAEQRRQNEAAYGELLTYKENFETSKGLQERQEDLEMQLANKQSGADLAATAFASIRDSVANASTNRLMDQYMKKLEGSLTTVATQQGNMFSHLMSKGTTTDTDGDGVMDAYDSDPNDPNVPNVQTTEEENNQNE